MALDLCFCDAVRWELVFGIIWGELKGVLFSKEILFGGTGIVRVGKLIVAPFRKEGIFLLSGGSWEEWF